MATPTRWQVFIDESGDFGKGTEVVVAGLLVIGSKWEEREKEMIGVLRRAALGLPWPLHACVVRKPAALAVAALAGPTRGDGADDGPSGNCGDSSPLRAGRRLFAEYPQEVRGMLAMLEKGEMPRWEQVAELDAALKKLDRELYDSVYNSVRVLEAEYRRICRTLAGASVNGAGLALFLAGESRPKEWRPPERIDRYMALLDTLLARVARSTDRMAGFHDVEVLALQRNILHDCGMTRAMDRFALACSLQRIRLPSHRVSMRVGQVCRWDGRVRLPHVLVDLAANMSLRACGSGASLRDVEQRVTARIAAGIRSGNPSRSHVAAAGRATAFLEAGPERGRGFDWSGVRTWAREQAEEWA